MINQNMLLVSNSMLVLILILMVALLLLCIFVKNARLIFGGLLCLLLAVTGIPAAKNDIEYFTASGNIYGVSQAGEHNKTKAIFDGRTNTITFSSLGFDSTLNINEYESTVKFEDVQFPLTNASALYLNNKELQTIEQSTEHIITLFSYKFYDSDNKEVCADDLTISIYTYANYFDVKIKTNGGDKAVKYWKLYMAKNNFVLNVKNLTKPVNNSISFDTEPLTKDEVKQLKVTLNINYDTSCENDKMLVVKVLDIKTKANYSYTFLTSSGYHETLTLSGFGETAIMVSFINPSGHRVTVSVNGSEPNNAMIFSLKYDNPHIVANINVVKHTDTSGGSDVVI